MNHEQFKIDTDKVITSVGDKIANMIEQMVKGGWIDTLGHPVKNNAAMLQMQVALVELMQFRARNLNYSRPTFPPQTEGL